MLSLLISYKGQKSLKQQGRKKRYERLGRRAVLSIVFPSTTYWVRSFNGSDKKELNNCQKDDEEKERDRGRKWAKTR